MSSTNKYLHVNTVKLNCRKKSKEILYFLVFRLWLLSQYLWGPSSLIIGACIWLISRKTLRSRLCFNGLLMCRIRKYWSCTMPSFLDSSLCQCQQRFLHQSMVNVVHWHLKDCIRELSLVFEMIGLEDINSASSSF